MFVISYQYCVEVRTGDSWPLAKINLGFILKFLVCSTDFFARTYIVEFG